MISCGEENLSLNLLSKNNEIKIYRSIIMHLVSYMCEIWSIILREEQKVRKIRKRVLGRIFGQKRQAITERCKEINTEELNDLYISPNVIWFIN